ncbi:MAG: hypothetical protein AAF688_09185 [Bacteroidota bacterium]
MIKLFRKSDKKHENLAPTLKGGFSKLGLLSVDIPLGIEGERKGKNI